MYQRLCHRARRGAGPIALFLLSLPVMGLAETLTFDWPAPASGRLVLEENTNDREVTTEMRVRISPVEDGTKKRLDFTDVRITEINGNDVTAPEEQAHLPPKFRLLTTAVPSLIVDGDAKIVAIPGVEEQVDAMIEETAERSPEVSPEDLRLTFLDPAVLDLLRAKVDGFWHLWVGLWMDKDFEPGKRLDFDAEVDYLGITVPAQGHFELLDATEGHQGTARLVFELVSHGDPLREAVSKSLGVAFEQAEQPIPEGLTLEALKSAERRERVYAVLDSQTMRPHKIRKVTSLTLDYADHGPQAKIEEKVFRFDWEDSE